MNLILEVKIIATLLLIVVLCLMGAHKRWAVAAVRAITVTVFVLIIWLIWSERIKLI